VASLGRACVPSRQAAGDPAQPDFTANLSMVGVAEQPRSQRFYTPYEVAQHCSPGDCWVSCLGHVLDLSQVVKVRRCCQWLVALQLFHIARPSVQCVQPPPVA
jgi:hypothetical protein